MRFKKKQDTHMTKIFNNASTSRVRYTFKLFEKKNK